MGASEVRPGVCIGCVVASVITGAVVVSYLADVHSGIVKHTPPCAPITILTVLTVFALTGIGAALGATGAWQAPRRWLPVALLALALNGGAISVWGYWLGTETLLPYDAWCRKVGMP